MLLLVTLALVVASAVLLILGFVQDALGFIYLSMLCAGVAALALFVFARLARRRSAVLAGAGVVGSAPAEEARPTSRTRAVNPSGGQGQSDLESEPTGAVAVRTEAEPLARSLESQAPLPAAGEDEPDRFDGAWRPEPDTAVQPVVRAAEPVAGEPDDDGDAWAEQDGEDWAEWGDEVVFPIEDYDELRVAEILPLLGQLEPDELQEVRDRELAGKARATVLDRIDDRLGRPSRASRPAPATPAPAATGGPAVVDEPAAPVTRARRAPAPAPAPAQAPAARKAPAGPARKAAGPAPAKKATARKVAAEVPEVPEVPAEPVPVRKAPSRKTAAAKTSARKAPAEKALAEKASAEKAPAEKAPAERAPAKRAAAKKAAPAKAAGAKRVAAASQAAPAETAAAAPAQAPVDQVPPLPRKAARRAPARKTP